MINIKDYKQEDTITITGIGQSNADLINRKFTNLKCMISTISKDETTIKVWPDDEPDDQLTEKDRYYGKIWFNIKDIESIQLIHRHDDWAKPRKAIISLYDNNVKNELVDSALVLVDRLYYSDPPNDVYTMPDGEIVFEWQNADDSIARIEIEEVGKGEFSMSYPDKPMEFKKCTWDTKQYSIAPN